MSESRHRSHGTGTFRREDFRSLGADCVFEAGVLVFHPENISLGRNVYVGHHAILKGYHKGELRIGDETSIGQQCFMHAGGGLTIGARVGIGPGVKILTSEHGRSAARRRCCFPRWPGAPVMIADDADIGIGAILLPGVRVGRGAVVGAGAVGHARRPSLRGGGGEPAHMLPPPLGIAHVARRHRCRCRWWSSPSTRQATCPRCCRRSWPGWNGGGHPSSSSSSTTAAATAPAGRRSRCSRAAPAPRCSATRATGASGRR